MTEEKLIIQGCKTFAKIFNQYKVSNWIRVKSDIYISRLSKEQIGFMSLIARYPKFECRVEEDLENIRFNFILLWKLKGIKELQSKKLGLINYDKMKRVFSKFKEDVI